MWQVSLLVLLCASTYSTNAFTQGNRFNTNTAFGTNNIFHANFYIDTEVSSSDDAGAGYDGVEEFLNKIKAALGINVPPTENEVTTSKPEEIVSEESYLGDCYEVLLAGKKEDGRYTIKPEGSEPFEVYCDQTTAGGGWTVLQDRSDAATDFNRGWEEYKNGFGEKEKNFWLGLEKIYLLTKQKYYELRVELLDILDIEIYEVYNDFSIGTESTDYRLDSVGIDRGLAGDSLSQHVGYGFSTYDRGDHSYCAVEPRYSGAWWYHNCYNSNLNGKYNTDEEYSKNEIVWLSFRRSTHLKKARMMIRPRLAASIHEDPSTTTESEYSYEDYGERALPVPGAQSNNLTRTTRKKVKHERRTDLYVSLNSTLERAGTERTNTSVESVDRNSSANWNITLDNTDGKYNNYNKTVEQANTR